MTRNEAFYGSRQRPRRGFPRTNGVDIAVKVYELFVFRPEKLRSQQRKQRRVERPRRNDIEWLDRLPYFKKERQQLERPRKKSARRKARKRMERGIYSPLAPVDARHKNFAHARNFRQRMGELYGHVVAEIRRYQRNSVFFFHIHFASKKTDSNVSAPEAHFNTKRKLKSAARIIA